jgi:hypothetical protein
MKIGETKERVVTFSCYPWQAPSGGSDCNLCNKKVNDVNFPEHIINDKIHYEVLVGSKATKTNLDDNCDIDYECICVPDEKIVAVGWTKDIRPLHPEIPIIGVEEVGHYPEKHSATSGYAAIHYYLNRGHEVFLCGFKLSEASYYKTTKLHLPDFETDMIESMIAMGMIARHY